jgi:hypothetical protein
MFRLKSKAGMLALIATAGFGLAGLASPAGAAGNSANAKLCQKGGWQSLQTGSGGSFGNQGACVSYGAHGGQIFDPTLTVTPNPVASDTPVLLVLAGFHANSAGTLTAAMDGQPPYTSIPLTTNADGGFSLSTGSGCLPTDTNYDLTFTDASGVHATGEFTVFACGT